MSNSISDLHSFCSKAWGNVKTWISVAEPYQPWIAGGLIVGKLGWRFYRQKPLEREIKKLNERIQRNAAILNISLETLHEMKRNSVDLSEGPDEIMLRDRIRNLQLLQQNLLKDLKEKKQERSDSLLTLGEIPSFFFAHPGANSYQSIHYMVGRTIQMRRVARPVSGAPSTFGSRLKKAAKLSMGLISMAGTGASLGRSMKWIAEDNRTSHLLSGLAIGVHALEGVILVINTLKSSYRTVFPGFVENRYQRRTMPNNSVRP